MRQALATALFCSGLTIAAIAQHSSSAPTPPRRLEAGTTVRGQLTAGRTDVYRVMLSKGQYVHAIVSQEGIDVAVTLRDSSDGVLITLDESPETHGAESLHWIADAAGAYQLSIRALANDTRVGSAYVMHLVERRPSTPNDTLRVDAQAARAEAASLRHQGTKAGLEAAIEKLTGAVEASARGADPEGEAAALYDLAQIYADLGNNRTAAVYDERAILAFEALGDPFDEGLALLRAGEAYRTLGDTQKGLTYYNRALPMLRAAKDSAGEGEALGDIGEAHFMLREMERALEYDAQAVALLRLPEDKASVLNNMGAVYRNLGEPEKARRFYLQALPIAHAAGKTNLEAIVLDNVGVLSLHLGDLQQALTYFNRALPLRRTLGNTRGEALSLDNIGAVYLRLDQPQTALDYHTKALALLEAIGDRYKQALVLGNIGAANYQLGHLDLALDYHTRAMTLFEAAGDRLEQSKSLKNVAVVQRDRGQLADARASSQKALDLLEFVRAHAGSAEERTAFVAAMSDHFDFAVDLLMRMHAIDPSAGHDLEALALNEQARARSLRELLGESYANIREGVDPSLLRQERELADQVTASLDSVTKLASRARSDEQRIAAEQSAGALTDRYRHIQDQIRRLSPRYAALTEPTAFTSIDVLRGLLDDNTMLLEYALGAEHSYLWAVTPARVLSYQLPPRREIEERARRVYGALIARQTVRSATSARQQLRVTRADAQYRGEAIALSRLVLGPVATALGSKRLAIVADGALHYVPFAALPDPDPDDRDHGGAVRPLLAAHEVVNVPSASVLALLRREASDRRATTNAVAVIADPVFSRDDARVRLTPGSRGAAVTTIAAGPESALDRAVGNVRGGNRTALRRLLFSRDEAEAILAVMPRAGSFQALDFAANRTLAMSDALRQYRVIHFATHALVDSAQPDLSGLVLSLVDESGHAQDGFLRLHEIYNLHLNADLVVLSACQTALGREVRGEGLIGLTRGFMYAGAPRVVASLWQVDDAATAQLMKAFYRGLARGDLTPAAALRAAQREMMAKPQWQAPYYWAAFVLQGEWR